MSDLTFVVVGNPNEGKSSVVSTLIERSDIRITEKPGETEFSTSYPLKIDGEVSLTFIDTPGFQTAKKTKKWIDAEAGNTSVDEWIERYKTAHQGNPSYKHDTRVLSAITDADCLLYVVDTSKPVGSVDRAEMEVLRRTGKPHMAIFNKKKKDSLFDREWHEAIRNEFGGICHEFNALNADFNERIALIKKLKAVDESWGGVVDGVVSGLEEDWDRRIRDVVAIIQNLLKECLSEKCAYPMKEDSDKEKAIQILTEKLQGKIRKYEKRAYQKIKLIFKHEKAGVIQDSFDAQHEDLFSKGVQEVFGLSKRQIIAVYAGVGAATGVAIDLALGGITFGIFTAAGGASGAVLGVTGATPLFEFVEKHPLVKFLGGKLSGQRTFSGIEVRIPSKSQLPYVLIDRAFCCYSTISHRAHAHGKTDVEVGAGAGTTLTKDWPKTDLIRTEKYFSKLRKNKSSEEEDKTFCAMLKRRILDEE